MIRGLDERFSSAASHINLAKPFPSFLEAWSMLLLEEMRLANTAANVKSTALVASSNPPPALVPCTGDGCRSDNGKGRNGKGKGRDNRRGPTTGPRFAPTPADPWFCFSPSQLPAGGASRDRKSVV